MHLCCHGVLNTVTTTHFHLNNIKMSICGAAQDFYSQSKINLQHQLQSPVHKRLDDNLWFIKIHVIEACSVIELVRHYLVHTLIQILECSSELPLMYSICKHSLVAPLFHNGSSYNHFTQWVPHKQDLNLPAHFSSIEKRVSPFHLLTPNTII